MNKTSKRWVLTGWLLGWWLGSSGLAMAGGQAISRAQLDLARKGYAQDELRVLWNTELGAPILMKAPDLGRRGLGFSSGGPLSVRQGGMSPDDAIAVLDNVAGVLRIRDAAREFSVRTIATDSVGNRHARVRQYYEGLRVVGGELMVHFDSSGKARSLNGRYVPDISLGTNPVITAASAMSMAMLDAEGQGMSVLSVLVEPELVIYASRYIEAPVLAYELTLETETKADGKREHWRYWINAMEGTLVHAYNRLNHGTPGAGSSVAVSGYRLTEEGGDFVTTTGLRVVNTYYLYLPHTNYSWIRFDLRRELDSSFINNGNSSAWTTSEGDRSELSAYENFILTANFYKTLFNRNGYDDAGGHMIVYVHSPDVAAAAYDRIWLGDGYSVLDVLAHEYTHCVIDDEPVFVYEYADSGAFHEGYADIFGVLTEFYSQADGRGNYPGSTAGTADWLVGEDTDLGRIGGYRALRDLRNPSGPDLSDDESPSRYKGSYWDPDQSMHVNSTVLGHFFYLLCEGGSGTNDGIPYNVTGAGVYPGTTDDYYPRSMAYNVLCNRATSENDYPEMRLLWQEEADANYPAYSDRVRAAWDAVGVSDQWDPSDDASTNATQLSSPTDNEQTHGTHLLTSSDSNDWFKVALSAGTEYEFGATDGSGNTYGELYSNSNGTTLLASDDNSGTGSHFTISYTPASSATYYLRIRAATPGSACEYILSYRAPPPSLLYVEVTGASNVNENSTSHYACIAYFDDSNSVDVTGSSVWTEDSTNATINSSGKLTTKAVATNTACQITATYDGQSDAHDLTIINVPTPEADFVITDIRLDPAVPTFGKTFIAYITVSNSGDLAAKVGSVYVWTNKSDEALVGQTPTKSKSLGTLHPGQIATATVTELKATVPGGLVFRAFVDAKAAIAELVETNNQAVLNYDVRTKPDLAVSAVTFSPSTPLRGGEFAASVSIKNSGSSNAAGFSVAVWSHLSGTPSNGTGADATVWVASLGTNQTLTLPVFTNITAGTGKTERMFRVLVDSDGDLDEVSESNNSSGKSYTPASKPDFVITGISLSPSNPIAGSNFTAYVVIRNQGYKSSSGGTLDVWANGAVELAPNTSNRGDKAVSVTSLAFGTQTTYSVTGLVAPTNAAGTLRATIDSRAAVTELVETNNTASLDYATAP